MSAIPDFAAPLAAALADARAAAAAAIAAELPSDVTLSVSAGAVALTGRALSVRSLTDPRLRDFAAIVRSAR